MLSPPRSDTQQQKYALRANFVPLLRLHNTTPSEHSSHPNRHIMGRTRRIWHRLWGSHDGIAGAAADATGDSNGCSVESPSTRVPTAEPDLATERVEKDIAKEIWLDAYKKLEEEEGTKKMVLAYETLLSNQLNGESETVSPLKQRVDFNWADRGCEPRLDSSSCCGSGQ